MRTDSAADKPKIAINRHLVMVIWIICVGIWSVMWFYMPGPEEDWQLWQAGFGRAGLIMFAIWLALPTRNREAAWANVSPVVFGGMIGGVIALAARPKIFFPLFAILGAIAYFLRPRKGARDRRPDRSSWKE